MNKRQPPPDFDDAAPLTDEEIARLRPASEVLGKKAAGALVRSRGRPKLEDGERKQRVTMRLSPDVLEAYRATGDGWQTRIDETLREALERKGMTGSLKSTGGSYSPRAPARSGSTEKAEAAKDRKAG